MWGGTDREQQVLPALVSQVLVPCPRPADWYSADTTVSLVPGGSAAASSGWRPVTVGTPVSSMATYQMPLYFGFLNKERIEKHLLYG
jgi:hypothetical protein